MESVFWYLLEIAADFYQGFMEIYFVSAFLTSKYKKDNRFGYIFVICSCILGGIQVVIDYLIPLEMQKAILCHVVVLFTYSMVMLKGSVIKKIFASAIPPLLIVLTAMVVLPFHFYLYQFVTTTFKLSNQQSLEELVMESGTSRFITMILAQVILYILVKLILKIYHSIAGRMGRINILECLLAFFVVVFSVLCEYLLQRERDKSVGELSRQEFDFLILTVIMICFVILIMMFVLGRYYQQQREEENIEQNKLYLKNELEIMKQAQLKMDCLRHDMKNHLYSIKNMAKENNMDNILRYVESGIESLTVDVQYVSTGNKNIDCMLNFKLDKARNENIVFTTNMTLPDELYINSFDINTILGNLLDNAMEAIEKVSEKKLDISIKYNKNILVIKIGNSFNGKISKNMRTTKANSSKHGLGLKSVQFVVEKYNGLIQYDYDHKYFVTKVLLYND